jgi:hypothetical protein
MTIRNAARISLALAVAAALLISAIALVLAVASAAQAVSGQRFCRYFPAAVTWHKASETEYRWDKLIYTAPNQYRADILAYYIDGKKAQRPNPGYKFRIVVRECNGGK